MGINICLWSNADIYSDLLRTKVRAHFIFPHLADGPCRRVVFICKYILDESMCVILWHKVALMKGWKWFPLLSLAYLIKKHQEAIRSISKVGYELLSTVQMLSQQMHYSGFKDLVQLYFKHKLVIEVPTYQASNERRLRARQWLCLFAPLRRIYMQNIHECEIPRTDAIRDSSLNLNNYKAHKGPFLQARSP